MDIFDLPGEEFKVYSYVCLLNNRDAKIESNRRWTIISPEMLGMECRLNNKVALRTIYRLKQKGFINTNEHHQLCHNTSEIAVNANIFYKTPYLKEPTR